MARAFDWLTFFRENHIAYVTSGPNIKRGELGIKCAWCGSADPSHHLGISIETGWWSCWRNRSQHSGKSPLRLIMKLLNVPYGRARTLAGLDEDYVDPEGFDAVAARLMATGTARPGTVSRRFLHYDKDFQPITDKIRTRKAWNYLYARRGFNTSFEDVDNLVKDYDLLTASRGDQQDRVIIPYYEDNNLVTWTGRAIGDSAMRYRDLPLKDCLQAPKFTLFNHDVLLTGGKILVVVEGPFDALKLDFYGKRYGVRAVALSTNTVKERQAFLLQPASDVFAKIVVMMDNTTSLGVVDSFRMKQDLFFIHNLSIAKVPHNYKDAGDMKPLEVKNWCRHEINMLESP